jgi:N-glycosylase/DNA lyase
LEREWGTTAEAVLTAIARSTYPTKRGIRGILAEATFEETILPSMRAEGWNSVVVVGDRTYDFALQQGRTEIRIQVKLQRREKDAPKGICQQIARRTEMPFWHYARC